MLQEHGQLSLPELVGDELPAVMDKVVQWCELMCVKCVIQWCVVFYSFNVAVDVKGVAAKCELDDSLVDCAGYLNGHCVFPQYVNWLV